MDGRIKSDRVLKAEEYARLLTNEPDFTKNIYADPKSMYGDYRVFEVELVE